MHKVKLPLLLITITTLSLLAGIGAGNIVRRQFLRENAEDTLWLCEQDETLTDCHVEWVYDGLVLVEFEVVGHDNRINYNI